MKKRALALGVVIIAVEVSVAIWLAQYQSYIMHDNRELQLLNSYFEGENRDLQDEKRCLLFETMDLESQNEELLKQLRDLTEQLALERALRVEIVALSHEDQWSDYGPFLGVQRARNVYNVTIRNNDVVALSGLELSVSTLSGERAVGWTFSNRSDMLLPGEERIIKGESVTPVYAMTVLSFDAVLKSGDVVVDELRLPVNATPF